jgi:predicted ATPase
MSNAFAFNQDSNLSLTSKLSNKDFALELIKTDKKLSNIDKIYLYKSLLKINWLTEYEKFLIEKILQKIKNDMSERWSVVFTGTLCSGKSTIINLFKEKGYMIMPEVAGDVIGEELKKLEDERIVPWMGDVKRLKFQLQVARTQLERELEFKDSYIYLLDRGMPDGLAYLVNAGKQEETLPMFDFMMNYCKKCIYKLVFYFDPTDALESTSIRTENDAFRMQIARAVQKVYTDLGYKLLIVPLMSIQERFDFISLFVPENSFLQYFTSYDKIYYTWTQTDIIQKLFINADVAITLDQKLWQHIWQTIQNVDSFDLPADKKQTLRLIMFFHDLGKFYGNEKHEFKSAAMAFEILTKLNFDLDKKLSICKMIEYHSDFGMFPNIPHDLTELSKSEIEMLYYVSLADIKTRKEFDTFQNRRKLEKLRDILLAKDKNAIEDIKSRLKLIYIGIKSNRAYNQLNIFNLNIYILQDLFYGLNQEDNIIKNCSKIIEAV